MEIKEIKTELDLPASIYDLATTFKKNNETLYVVGGFVRNCVLNIIGGDIDLCSSLLPNEVIILCVELGFKAQIVNEKLGTVLITTQDGQFEYTTFRIDNYDTLGNHAPLETHFVQTLIEDASRRDFTCNALYYDVLNKKIIDCFDGINNIKNGTLKVINEKVFHSDGLRILRFVRFICELDFVPDKRSLKLAKQNAHKLIKISAERILKEIKLIVVSDLKYEKVNSHLKANLYFNKLNLWQYIFNKTFNNFKIKNKGVLFKTYKMAQKQLRYLSWVNMVLNQFLKTETNLANIEFLVQTLFGVTGIKESNTNMQNILKSYCLLNTVLYHKQFGNELCVEFNSLSGLATNYVTSISCKNIKALLEKVDNLKARNIPLTDAELNVSNTELIKAGVENKHVSKVRAHLFQMCLNEKIINNKSQLINLAIEIEKGFN